MAENKYGSLIENSEENKQLVTNGKECDKYDYLTAIACGAIGGIVDIFMVGAPAESALAGWTDQQVDNMVMTFARKMGWNPSEGKENSVASAIGFLEGGSKKFSGFKVNYDQRYGADVGNLFNMSTRNHHMMSLGHAPDVIGLFFSVLNQFTSTSSFIANGQLITIKTDTYELQGNNFVAKLFCGVANWFGHIMSDIAGSSGSRGNAGRGTGVVMPFYELFQFCKFGKFDVGKDKQDLATIATRAFQEGYDLRFGLVMSIPVVITDLSIRLIWSIRRYFQYEQPLKECIPTRKHESLRVMLLFGNGTLCVIDGLDAGVRSGGNVLAFFTRLNLVAWFRFGNLVLREVCIRVGVNADMESYLEAWKQINEGFSTYLAELKEIDIKVFEEETKAYQSLQDELQGANTTEQLNQVLLKTYERLNLQLPWEGEFDEFMSDKNAKLVFR